MKLNGFMVMLANVSVFNSIYHWDVTYVEQSALKFVTLETKLLIFGKPKVKRLLRKHNEFQEGQ